MCQAVTVKTINGVSGTVKADPRPGVGGHRPYQCAPGAGSGCTDCGSAVAAHGTGRFSGPAERGRHAKGHPRGMPHPDEARAYEHYKTFTTLMQHFMGLGVLNRVETMSATISNSRWDDLMKEPTAPVVSNSRNPFVRFGVQTQERHCPSCRSIVYTRRHGLCGACGESLPEDCRFTAAEAQNVAMLVRTERQRHREWLKKTETP